MRAWALLLLALAGCESSFDPIAPADLHFSLSGYLDASADTQWVRVEPFGQTAETTAAPIDAVVTLDGPGGVVEFRQQVRLFVTGPAHLFWTTADVEPGQVYRVRARAPDGSTTTAPVAIPDTAGVTIDVIATATSCPIVVSVAGAERLADVQSVYEVSRRGRRRTVVRSYNDFVRTRAGGALQTSVYPGSDLRAFGFSPDDDLLSASVKVAIATADWPLTRGQSIEDVLLLESTGLDQGVGFVGGVVTWTVPFAPRECYGPSPE
ncbi:hypothetical protein [Rubrivirga sp. IMCC43871]|uniref:hypothetical protein n=1 Tax=Rubrivirga sp. IMCC43871 TaxID=3391575 RepID=UPI0039900838